MDRNQECESACARLCVDFAWFVDNGEYEELVALFAEQGTFERRGDVWRGRASILAGMRARPAATVSRHVCTNIRIRLQADGSALGSSYLLLFQSADAATGGATPAPILAEYSDVYVQEANGWRIASRVARVVF